MGGKKIKDSTGKVVGTTTGKYGGRLGRVRNKNMKTYDQIKKDIDLKDLQKASDAKARKIARSKELKDLTEKTFNTININNVRNEYSKKILLACLNISELSNDI